uniref:WD repeat domain phosphoinositide-interacting protein 4 n=1 Tax=Gongylonema pulchrum TaxID=637853 RepID=A0A183DB04_9BILA
LTAYTINAHQSAIALFALNSSASLLATGSVKGTVIRLFDTKTTGQLREFRRGADPANLHCLRFSPCSSFLAVSSDKDTVHIFAVKNDPNWANRKTVWQQVGFIAEETRRACVQLKLSRATQSATRTELAFLTAGINEASELGSTESLRTAQGRCGLRTYVCHDGGDL